MYFDEHISKISLQGGVIDKNFITGLNNPTGMSIYNDILYISENNTIVLINLETGEKINRIEIPDSMFLNDITIDENGNVYISDTRKDVIWKISNGSIKEWICGKEINDPNAMYYYKGKLLFGNSGDSCLKSIDPETKTISKIVQLPKGIIDGIRPTSDGDYFVSLWKGKIYKVNPGGTIKLMIHTENNEQYSADFEYIIDQGLFIVPTFYNNTVSCYKYHD